MTDQRTKRQRLGETTSKTEKNETKPVDACETEAKSITNIYYDCLERIFDFLELGNLLNVAGTCKRLQIAAAAYFGKRFSETRVSIYGFHRDTDWRARESAPKYAKKMNSIEVYAMNCGFPFLRCFGAKISNLWTDHNSEEDKRNNHLHRYIIRYCADTLKKCSFLISHAYSIENFSKPFEKVTKVDLFGSNMESQLPNLVKWFPNLRDLQMHSGMSIVKTAIAVYLPHLEHLTLTLVEEFENDYDDDNTCYLTSENAGKLLQANPQLQSLKVSWCLELALNNLINMISANSNISKLSCAISDLNEIDLNRFVAEHSMIVELTAHFTLFTPKQANVLIRQLKSLKYFEFQVKDQSECQYLLNQLDEKWKSEIYNSNAGIFIILRK